VVAVVRIGTWPATHVEEGRRQYAIEGSDPPVRLINATRVCVRAQVLRERGSLRDQCVHRATGGAGRKRAARITKFPDAASA